MAGDRPTDRLVVVPLGSDVLGSTVAMHTEFDVVHRIVAVDLPDGMGRLELRVPVELAPLFAAALAGRPGRRPEPTVMYRIECAAVLGSALVVEVPPYFTKPMDVAAFLAGRLEVHARAVLGCCPRINAMVWLDEFESYASLVIEQYDADRFAVVAVPAGGAS